jgi:uncharacterized repeat protein (TIGR01451 family)
MNWTFSQGYGIALTVLLTVFCAALTWLVARIAAKMPTTGSIPRRVLSGVRQTPVMSSIVAAVLLSCTAIFVAGFVLGPEDVTAEDPTADFSPAPNPTVDEADEPISLAGWGPPRNLFSESNRPTTATLNSVFDTEAFGYENNFLRVKPADAGNDSFTDSVVAQPGQKYTVVVAVHNDAAAGGDAVTGARLRVQMPATAKGSGHSYGFLSAANTSTTPIWDGATFVSEEPDSSFDLRYVKDSATLHTNGEANGLRLGEELYSDGVAIGCDALDGTIPAEERCAIWVTFEVHVDQPNFEASAVAKMKGSDAWSSSYVAQSGDKVRVAVTYKNTGTTLQNDVVLRVHLPPNAQYVAGSTTWRNASNQEPIAASDGIADRGINLGSYSPGANASAEFEMVVQDPGDDHSLQKVSNFFTAETNNGNKSAPLTLVWLG